MTALTRLLARLTAHLEDHHRRAAVMAAIRETHRSAITTRKA